MEIKYIGKCLLIETKGERILVVGDLHIGYEQMLNDSGVFVGRKMYDEMISEFDAVFEKVGRVDKIVLLGDVKHEFYGNNRQEWSDVLNLMQYLKEKSKEVVVIRGNHDNFLKTILSREEIKVEDYLIIGEFCFLHGDKDYLEAYENKVNYWIIGHLHPAVKLREGNKVEKYKCFLEGKFKNKKVIIVPSFFGLVEGTDLREEGKEGTFPFEFDKFNVKIVAEELKVLDFGKLGEL